MALVIGSVPQGFFTGAGGPPPAPIKAVPNGVLIPLPPPHGGAVGWGTVYLSFGSDFGGARLRVAIYSGTSKSWRIVHLDVVDAGPRVGVSILDGDEKVSVCREMRTPDDDGLSAVGWMLETTLQATS